MDRVSIKIVTWNSERYITACLKSVFEQTFKNFEASVLGERVFATLDDLQRQAPGVKFTFIFMEQVIEHLRDPILTLSELRSLAGRDALLYVGTPNAGGANAAFFGSRWREMQNPTHLWFFNWRALVRLLQAAGWRALRRLIKGFRYPDSGMIRGAVQQALGWAGLEGALRLTARPSAGSADGTIGILPGTPGQTWR